MSSMKYDFPISSDVVRRTTTAWLMLGLVSLVGAGLFSIDGIAGVNGAPHLPGT